MSLADDMRTSPSLRMGLPDATADTMADLLESIEKVADKVWGVTSGPRWSWDAPDVGGHLSATYDIGALTMRARVMIDVDGVVLSYEERS
jgi:hypothetical protein